jgi:uncharacterized protein YlxW (UPF0749 family)
MNKHRRLYFFIIALLLGVIGTLQIRSNFTYNGIVTISNLLELQNEIENIQNENKLLKESTEEMQIKLKVYKDSLNITGSIYGNMEAELQDTNHIAGMEKVEGSGVIITLNDSIEEVTSDLMLDWILVHDTDILEIVNELRAAGAEAISINDERVIATTSVRCGGPTILIDDKRHAIPFVIKAIGDPNKLYAIATAPDSYIDWLNSRGVRVSFYRADKLIINGYNGRDKLYYQKKIEGGEVK